MNLQKHQYIHNKKLRQSARGEDCTVNIYQVCNFNPETTILAHIDSSLFGKGTGIKGDDLAAAYACSACHDWLALETSVSAIDRLDLHYRAAVKTHIRMFHKGVIKIA